MPGLPVVNHQMKAEHAMPAMGIEIPEKPVPFFEERLDIQRVIPAAVRTIPFFVLCAMRRPGHKDSGFPWLQGF